MSKRLPQVVLVGRINAGKSTLFNTLSETTQAIVSPLPGTTRDLNYARMEWSGSAFELVDTGGLDSGKLGAIEQFVQKKAYRAIEKSDCIILVVDGQTEPTPEDKKIARLLKKTGRPIIFAINKIDNVSARKNFSPDFYKLGLGQPSLISALSGIGTGDLLDVLIRQLPKRKEKIPLHAEVRLAIIGKTNVGKSSLLNALVGAERVIVTPLPHTTREPQDTYLTYQGRPLVIVDTAGLRKKKARADSLEKMGVKRTLTVIAKSDVCLFVTDASLPLSSQDQHIADLARARQNGILIVVNKWDLIKDKNPQTFSKFIAYYQRYFPSLYWAPIIFVSAQNKQRLTKLLDIALTIHDARQRWWPPEELETFIRAMERVKKIGRQNAKKQAGPYALRQTGIAPPSFTFQAPRREDIHPAWLNVLEKELRKKFDLNGTPVAITLDQQKKRI